MITVNNEVIDLEDYDPLDHWRRLNAVLTDWVEHSHSDDQEISIVSSRHAVLENNKAGKRCFKKACCRGYSGGKRGRVSKTRA